MYRGYRGNSRGGSSSFRDSSLRNDNFRDRDTGFRYNQTFRSRGENASFYGDTLRSVGDADRGRKNFASSQEGDNYGVRGSTSRGRGFFDGNRGRGFGDRRGRPGHGGVSSGVSANMPESVYHKQLVKQNLGSGREGKQVELLSNFFKIITDGKVVYHYAIDLKKVAWRPEDPESGNIEQYVIVPVQKGYEMFLKKVSAEILDIYFKQNAEVFGRIPFVHDGAKKLYSTSRLDLRRVPQVQTFNIGRRKDRLAVIFSLAAEIDLQELDEFYASGGEVRDISPSIVPVFEQVFCSVIEKQFFSHQSGFYDLRQRMPTSSRAFEFVRGFTTSVRMTEFGLALNLHLKCSCLIEQNIVTLDQLVLALLNRHSLDEGGLSNSDLKKLNKILSGLKVQTKHTRIPGLFTIDGLSHKTTVRHQFQISENRLTNVQEYFFDLYNMKVKDMNLVRTRTPLATKGSVGKKEVVMLPLEACYLVPNQFIAEFKLPAIVQAEHLQISTLEPNVYFPQVCHFVKIVARIAPDLFTSFGINLTTLPVKFPARILELPKIRTAPRDFHIPANSPTKWAVFCFDDTVEKGKLDRFINDLMEAAKKKNIHFNKPSPVFTVNVVTPEQVGWCLENLKTVKQAEFALIVIPSESELVDKIYNFVKFGENIDENIITQCVLSEKLKVTPRGYFDNLLDKINAKLGGTNQLVSHEYIENLPLRLSETMVVGADVNHPGMVENVPLSIAAVVGSFDANMSLYASATHVQKKDRIETINNIGEMVEKLLAHYKKKNGERYPRNVVVFRDGVGDGHIKVIRDTEMGPLEAKLKRLIPDVKIAFIIVQKRHIARFGLTSINTSGRRPTYNLESGTVIDTHIVEPMIDGMVLNSHFSQLGTSKPSKYTILRDDFGMKADQLERLCFFSCHNCARTRKIISIPTSIRYADLCAYRVKQLAEAYQTRNPDMTKTSLTFTGDTEYEEEIVKKLADALTISYKTSETLFFI